MIYLSFGSNDGKGGKLFLFPGLTGSCFTSASGTFTDCTCPFSEAGWTESEPWPREMVEVNTNRKNTSWFTVPGSRLARFFVTIFPVSENTRSEGTDVPGIQRKNLAIGASFLYPSICFPHHSRGSALPFTADSLRNISYSSIKDFSVSTSSPVRSTRSPKRKLEALTSSLLLSLELESSDLT